MDEQSKHSYDSLTAERDYRKGWSTVSNIIGLVSLLSGCMPMIVFTLMADTTDEGILRFLNLLTPIYRFEQFVLGLASGHMEKPAATGISVLAGSLLVAVPLTAAALLLRFIVRRADRTRRSRLSARPDARKRSASPGTVSVAAEEAAAKAAAHVPAPQSQPDDKTQNLWRANAGRIRWDTSQDSRTETLFEPFEPKWETDIVAQNADEGLQAQSEEESLSVVSESNRDSAFDSIPDRRVPEISAKDLCNLPMNPEPGAAASWETGVYEEADMDSTWHREDTLYGEIRKPEDGGISDFLSIPESAPSADKEEAITMKPEESGTGIQAGKLLTGLTEEAKAAAEDRMDDLQKEMNAVSFDRSCIRIQLFGDDNRITEDVRMMDAKGPLRYDLKVAGSIQTVEFWQTENGCKVCFKEPNEGKLVHKMLVWNRPVPFSFKDRQHPHCVITWFGGGRK